MRPHTMYPEFGALLNSEVQNVSYEERSASMAATDSALSVEKSCGNKHKSPNQPPSYAARTEPG